MSPKEGPAPVPEALKPHQSDWPHRLGGECPRGSHLWRFLLLGNSENPKGETGEGVKGSSWVPMSQAHSQWGSHNQNWENLQIKGPQDLRAVQVYWSLRARGLCC